MAYIYSDVLQRHVALDEGPYQCLMVGFGRGDPGGHSPGVVAGGGFANVANLLVTVNPKL